MAMKKRRSREQSVEELRESIARGDFAAAGEVLEAAGKANKGKKRQPARPSPAPAPQPRAPVGLADACPGEEVVIAAGDKNVWYWRMRRTLGEIGGEDGRIASEYAAVLRGARQQFDELAASPALCHAADAGPEDLLFMDTETCGLAAMPIFLVGVMFFEEGELVFEQYLARDYAQEPGILRAFASRHETAGVLVTFNGKAFDLPMIRDRGIVHGLPEPWSQPPHLDLLPEVRKRWRRRLRSCALQAVERRLLNRRREDDIPSAQIPDAYHQFVRTGDARQIAAIVHHNLLDLLSMAQIVCLLLTGCDPLV